MFLKVSEDDLAHQSWLIFQGMAGALPQWARFLGKTKALEGKVATACCIFIR